MTPRAPPTYPVGVEELNGSQDVELAGHEELDGHVPGERGHIVLACPLVDLFQELLGGLQDRRAFPLASPKLPKGNLMGESWVV